MMSQTEQKYNTKHETDVLKPSDKIGVSALCQQIEISTDTVSTSGAWSNELKQKSKSVQSGETQEKAVVVSPDCTRWISLLSSGSAYHPFVY